MRGPGGDLSSSTADEYLDAFHGGNPLRLRDPAHRLVAAIATLGTDGALGLEGPSIYVGATLGAATQRRFRRLLVGADPNLLLVAGAAAGIAAIFKAPATGAPRAAAAARSTNDSERRRSHAKARAPIPAAKRIADSGHPVMRVIAAAGSIAALFAIGRGLTGESLVLTPGYGVVQWALDPSHRARRGQGRA